MTAPTERSAPSTHLPGPEEVVAAWQEAGPERWFKRDDAFDLMLRERFLPLQEAAAQGRLDHWQETPEGTLALVLCLDQFPRNMYRGTPRAFASDASARIVARSALERGIDTQVAPELRSFLYLPFMHSEELADQQLCVSLYEALGDAYSLSFAREHHDIIEAFGRFPHRNPILDRGMTPEEQAYLDKGGFTG